MFLTHWTLGFDPDMEISVALEWVKLPYLPIIFWDESILKDIRNKHDHFIDWAELSQKEVTIPVLECVWK